MFVVLYCVCNFVRRVLFECVCVILCTVVPLPPGADPFAVNNSNKKPIPVAERCKAWVCSRSPARVAGSNPAEGMDVCL